VAIEISYKELTLLRFSLEGGRITPGTPAAEISCEEACPAFDQLRDLLDKEPLPPEKELARHLDAHLREAMIECGLLEVAGTVSNLSERQDAVGRINERLTGWKCRLELAEGELRILSQALRRLPASAWISMPRVIWRLRKKLKVR
jgi:hypothetical protein